MNPLIAVPICFLAYGCYFALAVRHRLKREREAYRASRRLTAK